MKTTRHYQRRDKSRATDDQPARVRRRMSMLADDDDLARRLGPLDAAGTCIGAGVGVLETVYGKSKAVYYPRELAIELEMDDDLPPSTVGMPVRRPAGGGS